MESPAEQHPHPLGEQTFGCSAARTARAFSYACGRWLPTVAPNALQVDRSPHQKPDATCLSRSPRWSHEYVEGRFEGRIRLRSFNLSGGATSGP